MLHRTDSAFPTSYPVQQNLQGHREDGRCWVGQGQVQDDVGGEWTIIIHEVEKGGGVQESTIQARGWDFTHIGVIFWCLREKNVVVGI